MKHFFLFSICLLCVMTSFSMNHNINRDYFTKEVDSPCLSIFNRYAPKMKEIINQPSFNYHLSKMSAEVSFKNVVECSVSLANQGYQPAADSLVALTNYFFQKVLDRKKFSAYHQFNLVAKETLGRISSNTAFEAGLNYFSSNICVSDLIGKDNMLDYPNDNFGINAFQNVILPMIAENQRNYYQSLYKKTFNSYLNNYDYAKDDGMKIFHQLFYPLIKKDWEAGNIKLRE